MTGSGCGLHRSALKIVDRRLQTVVLKTLGVVWEASRPGSGLIEVELLIGKKIDEMRCTTENLRCSMLKHSEYENLVDTAVDTARAACPKMKQKVKALKEGQDLALSIATATV